MNQPRMLLGSTVVAGFVACAIALGSGFDVRAIPMLSIHAGLDNSRTGNGELRLVSIEQSADDSGDDLFQSTIAPFLEQYCLDCHSGDESEGDLDLARFAGQADVDRDLATWSKVLHQIEDGNMPPEEVKQPQERQIELFKNWILNSLASGARSNRPPGRMRRLNRVEYENTIRDLFRLTRLCFNNPARIIQTTDYFQPATGRMPRYVLAVSYFYNSHRRHSDLPGVSNLPVDPPVEHGFANDQDALSLSPLLLENYLEISTSLLNNSEFAQISELWDTMFIVPDSWNQAQRIRHGHEQIELFLPRAFRRSVTAAELERYQSLFDSELEVSGSYTESMRTTTSAILVSPGFLFRREFLVAPDQPQTAQQMEREKNLAIANRLSYFLWGSMPDDELIQAAREGRLTIPRYLERQVDRMMDDPKIKSLSTDFGMQWLKVQKAASALPDKTRFPGYYRNSEAIPPPAVSMMIEQLLFFEAVMVENRSIEEFVDSDFAFLNRQLMDWYQINPKTALGYSPAVEDFEDFFRIKWPNRHRGGVISSGAMLISTSTTTRTSPVYRGSWILDVVFNAAPPPPPANVPPLEPAEGQKLTSLNVRDKLAQHRQDAACASCHDRIDPMGFAFEMFDAVGRWRREYETGDEIDSSGEINGEKFVGSSNFKKVILRGKSRFVRAFVEHTMKYALGRQLHFSDEPEIRRVTAEVIKQNCRFRSVIKQVVLSEPFLRFEH